MQTNNLTDSCGCVRWLCTWFMADAGQGAQEEFWARPDAAEVGRLAPEVPPSRRRLPRRIYWYPRGRLLGFRDWVGQ